MSSPLIDAKALCLSLGGRDILQNVDLKLCANEIVTLIGPNGAGKTSLVKVVLGLTQPDSGTITRKPGICIGYMPQRLYVDANMPMTVERFLRFADPSKKHISQALEEVGTRHLIDNPLQGISGGEMQRILLARALLRKPQLLVLDEPVQGVDIAGQIELYQLISRIRDRHQCGVLMVSHDLHLVMAQTDTVVCLNHHICCHGHPEQVSNDPAYLELFGKQHSETLAVYQHNHDHNHNIHGDIVHKHKAS